jgi:ribonuclease HI
MELMAVIAGLEALNRDNVSIIVHTDSRYIVNAVEQGWVWNWLKKDFKDKKNKDLWLRFIPLYKKHRIKFVWVKGHADNLYNNRCDQLATAAADGRHLLADEGYEKEERQLF